MNLLAYPGLPNNYKKVFQLAIKEHFESDPSHRIGMAIAKVCNHFDISSATLKSKSRKKELVWARCIVMHYLRNNTALSLQKIGSMMGGRDHATIIYQLEQYDGLLKYDKPFQHIIKTIDL